LYQHPGWVGNAAAVALSEVTLKTSCPAQIAWPQVDSALVFDRSQGGTMLLVGASAKQNKSGSNANTCAYKMATGSDLFIPKGTRAVCPKTYAY
jgi:hypothetical protein